MASCLLCHMWGLYLLVVACINPETLLNVYAAIVSIF